MGLPSVFGRRWHATAAAKGVAYEEMVAKELRKLGCDLAPTAMSMDGGIDHIGMWAFPDASRIRIVTQCKHEEKPTGVTYLREFEGVLGKQPPSTIGVFASASGYSLYAKRFFTQMAQPAMRLTLNGSDGLVEFDMNTPARRLVPKLVPGSTFLDGSHVLVLTYDGHVLDDDDT
ncbi:hypothetical protein SDRG_01151 [Saprolegnia diclina VS20]|uniref:Restriction endonuclease type IV Mrr domain-containing protein n=1 Tax=Saprolegnia diclina (strain VS20) TaxID=1156394 RepID=T0R4A4_SAPDV|nr:hypothetical protein SDRG_01151 [Saprolegnia diclina VS20]EQC41175.1 hypothetical protein SDRG_01151 [Saprolegnia diclina VS20]|eukprot:XP_008604889.1 hypothetical protein SDRG_01151 [Saprolegnia diclina VS20]